MKYNFVNLPDELSSGLAIAARLLGWELSDDGVKVEAAAVPYRGFKVEKADGGFRVEYGERAMFFRALGFINQNKEVAEQAHFEYIGWQMDVSQTNALPKLEQMEELLCRIALMGMNRLVLYMEDSFEIPEEPYFGYMRSRYSESELRAIDDIADIFGIEVFAAVEGLSHLSKVLRWHPYGDMQEDAATLLVGEERTYRFLEHLIDAATKPFRSKNVIVFLDEAFNLGKGTSLEKSGEYRESFYYMKQHIPRLIEMCRERGLNMITSGDMFMVASNPDEDNFFKKLYAIKGPLSKEIIDAADWPVDYLLWDYSHHDESTYEALIKRYREFGKCEFFLAGIWNWLGFGVDYDKTFATVIPAARACKKNGIKDFVVTTWGCDAGMENFWSDNLLGLQLVAEHSYGDEPSDSELAERFFACTGCNMNDFLELSYVDHVYGQRTGEGPDYVNLSRTVMWQDLLFGKYDYHIKDNSLAEHFKTVAEKLEAAAERNGNYGKYLATRALLARVLEIKATIGVRITTAYRKRDIYAMCGFISTVLPELKKRVLLLRDSHRDLWYSVHKPMGWEAEDARYGVLLSRIDSAIYRLQRHINGWDKTLPELEAERLSASGGEEMPRTLTYIDVISASYITP